MEITLATFFYARRAHLTLFRKGQKVLYVQGSLYPAKLHM